MIRHWLDLPLAEFRDVKTWLKRKHIGRADYKLLEFSTAQGVAFLTQILFKDQLYNDTNKSKVV